MRIITASFLLLIAGAAYASQPLETETARLLPAGVFKIELTGEYQKSGAGTERAVPLVLEYGLAPRTEIAVEPVFATSIRPKVGRVANGVGDLEITITHLLRPEAESLPAFALAGEVKIPTAKNRQIGTGKTDLTAWGIVSQRFGRVDVHGNLGYTIVGQPAGTRLKNVISFAVASELHVSSRFDVVGELIGNTSSTGDNAEGTSGSGATVISSEAPSGETSAMAGVRWHLSPDVIVSMGLSYDNNHALLFRPGVTWRFGGR